MLVGNLPTALQPLQDVQKFSIEKELRKLLAFCGPIKAIGFDTRRVNEADYFTGTVRVDFEVAADAEYAMRLYNGYTMTSGSPLGKRLECSLNSVQQQKAPQQHIHNAPSAVGESKADLPLQKYLHAGLYMNSQQHDAEAEREPVPTQSESASNGHTSIARLKAWWEELTGDEKRAAERLGWSKDTWEAGAAPATGVGGWATLNNPEMLAAVALGYDQEVWDAEGARN